MGGKLSDITLQNRLKEALDKGSMFYGRPCKYGHDGLRHSNNRECVYCVRIKTIKYNETRKKYRDKNKNNPEYISKQAHAQRKWRLKHPEAYLLRIAKNRAKEKGLDFNIDETDIKIPEFCPVLNFRLEQVISLKDRGTSKKWNSASLDRVDNSKGYVKGNVQVISLRANMLKNNSTVEELEKIIQYMRNNQNV